VVLSLLDKDCSITVLVQLFLHGLSTDLSELLLSTMGSHHSCADKMVAHSRQVGFVSGFLRSPSR